jgi:hypothetical protein
MPKTVNSWAESMGVEPDKVVLFVVNNLTPSPTHASMVSC